MPPTPKNRYFDDPEFKFDNTAIVLLNTSFANYEFVAALNQAYNLSLTRIDDLVLDVTSYPCFIYQDSVAWLYFVMLERSSFTPANAVFEYYDKMLLIRGRDAKYFQQRLYDDLTLPRPEPPTDELQLHHRWELLNMLCEGVFEPVTFNLKDSLGLTQTSLYSGPDGAMPRRLQTFISQLRQFLTDAFATFEWHLSNPD